MQPPLSFFVIGAARSGTTSLHRYLAQHPALFLPPMKPRYLALLDQDGPWPGPGDADLWRNSIREEAAYRALFAGVRPGQVAGEVSTLYLYAPPVAGRIRDAFPRARLIALLRNPADRAFSAYQTMRRRGLEPLDDFEAALAAEPDRIARGWSFAWHYRRVGAYHEQLTRYTALFPPEQLRVHLFDDFARDPLAVVQDCFRFLGVDDGFRPDVSVVHNVSGAPRSRLLETLLARPNPLRSLARAVLPLSVRRRLGQAPAAARMQARNTRPVALSPALRKALTRDFREDILRLQNLLRRDLSAWLS